jgi:hypothetical protein
LAAAKLSGLRRTRPQQKPKTGCCSRRLHGYAPGSNVQAAIETIAGLGFDAVEPILLAP